MQSNYVGTKSPHLTSGYRAPGVLNDAVWTHPEFVAGGLSVLRAIVGFLFIAHGLQKIMAFPAPVPGPAIDLMSVFGAAGLIEMVGGALIIVGLFTRPVAFILSGEMAAAYFMQHAAAGFWPLLNGGELAALYCFVFLFFAVAGGGAWSIDAIRYGAPAPAASEGDI